MYARHHDVRTLPAASTSAAAAIQEDPDDPAGGLSSEPAELDEDDHVALDIHLFDTNDFGACVSV